MGLKAQTLEIPIWLAGKSVKSYRDVPSAPKSIFILRNNDIGDLLATSPLFEALKQVYPATRIVVGVGPWNEDTLKYNPHVDEVIIINAPWCNRTTHDLPLHRVYANALRYIFGSTEVRRLRERKFSVGIDVYGSQHGSILLLFLGIPFRLGVKGYFAGGGHSACQLNVRYVDHEHVSRQNLRFAELLGAKNLPESRPQIFLSAEEKERGESFWAWSTQNASDRPVRFVIAPGAGHPRKSWGSKNYIELAKELAQDTSARILVLGGPGDAALGDEIAGQSSAIASMCGKLSMRETFSAVASSDLVFCNSSMMMHVAGAFKKPEVVLLSEAYVNSEQHQAQWGYKETCISLGMSAKDRRPATVSEALTSGMKLIAKL